MKQIALGMMMLAALVVTGCTSQYATAARPVIFYSPKGLDNVKLTKAVAYGLASKRWRVTSYDLDRVGAEYRNIRIQVRYTPNGSITIHHMHEPLDSDEAAQLKKWINDFQYQLMQVAQYDTLRLDKALRKVNINPMNIENLATMQGDKEN